MIFEWTQGSGDRIQESVTILWEKPPKLDLIFTTSNWKLVLPFIITVGYKS